MTNPSTKTLRIKLVIKFRDDLPEDKEYNNQRFQCDIFCEDGSDHHALGAIRYEAIDRAIKHWLRHEDRNIH